MTTQQVSTSVPTTSSQTGTTRAAGTLPLLGILTLTALLALGLTLLMPRGPVTAGQFWLVLLSSLALGVVSGFWVPRRWIVPVIFVLYAGVVELSRIGAVGPTVDAPRLDNLYGILAQVLGRGFHGLALLPALWLGVEVGRAWTLSAGLDRSRVAYVASRPLVITLTLIVGGLSVLNAIPARTPPIVDADGAPVPGSIAELTTVELGGREQALLIRGQSTDLPVLLYLAGGPGQSDLPFPRVLFEDWTEQVIVVGWDQRGTGKSYAALDPTSEFTLAQMVADTNELAEQLRARFDEEKIYLMGESWGTTLGVLALQERPDLYHAFIGSGQMVSQRETDRRLYHELLAWADAHGDAALRAELEGYGEPPYADLPWANLLVAMHYSDLETPYTRPAAYVERGTEAKLGFFGVMGSEYAFVEKANVLRGLMDMFTVMYPQLQEIDFRRDVPRVEVPLYIVDGESELAARRDLALEWFAMVDAPLKRIYTFENAGHSVAFEHFEALRDTILPQVLGETYNK